MAVSVTGVPCKSNVDSLNTSDFTFTGASPDYGVRNPVTLTGPSDSIAVTLDDTDWEVGGQQVLAGSKEGAAGLGQFVLQTPHPVATQSVRCHPTKDSRFRLKDAPLGRMVTLQGMSGDDHFVVPEMGKLQGLSTFLGGTGFDSMEVAMHVAPTGMKATIDHSSLVHKASGRNHTIVHHSVEQRVRAY